MANRGRLGRRALDRISLSCQYTMVISFFRLLSILIVGTMIQELHANQWTPVQHPLQRYVQIWKSSPFIAASEVTPQGESLAHRYAVTGFVRIGSADVVFLFDRKGLSRFSVGTESPAQGVELVEVSKSEDLALLRAKIRVEGQVVEIAYDASVSGGESGNKSPDVAQQKVSTPPPGKVAPPQGDTSSSAAKTSQNTGKPVKVIRRKPIEAP